MSKKIEHLPWERFRAHLSDGLVGKRWRWGASFRIWSPEPVIGSFGTDRGNGTLRSGALGSKRGTEFNGGCENGEAATGDCNGHLKHKAKAWLGTPVPVSAVFWACFLGFPLSCVRNWIRIRSNEFWRLGVFNRLGSIVSWWSPFLCYMGNLVYIGVGRSPL